MLELLRPCIEEASPVQNEDVALDMIGKRGAEAGVSREKRINFASDVLQKELLPHVGMTPNCRKKKAFFLGYMVLERKKKKRKKEKKEKKMKKWKNKKQNKQNKTNKTKQTKQNKTNKQTNKQKKK